MHLKSFRYAQYENSPKQWTLDELDLQPVNLIVGTNASGKTRTLNVINALSKIISGRQPTLVLSGNYKAKFLHENEPWQYSLHFEQNEVVTEELVRGNTTLLSRRAGGFGNIFAEKMGTTIEFQTPAKSAAVFARRDTVQHGFLETLAAWANGTFHYPFSLGMGQQFLGSTHPNAPPADLYDPNQVIGIFKKGEKELGQSYKDAIIRDMRAIGYDISDIGTKAPESIIIQTNLPMAEIFCLYVKERALATATEQIDMSQGMFRALSTLIQLNYGALSRQSACVIVDDIGEGLDFERSTALIKTLVEKAEKSGTQLLMSTNDRFVMNATPLNYWTVLKREGSMVHVYNTKNSQDKFEDFKFTGLSNFDFLATDFISSEKESAT